MHGMSILILFRTNSVRAFRLTELNRILRTGLFHAIFMINRHGGPFIEAFTRYNSTSWRKLIGITEWLQWNHGFLFSFHVSINFMVNEFKIPRKYFHQPRKHLSIHSTTDFVLCSWYLYTVAGSCQS